MSKMWWFLMECKKDEYVGFIWGSMILVKGLKQLWKKKKFLLTITQNFQWWKECRKYNLVRICGIMRIFFFFVIIRRNLIEKYRNQGRGRSGFSISRVQNISQDSRDGNPFSCITKRIPTNYNMGRELPNLLTCVTN